MLRYDDRSKHQVEYPGFARKVKQWIGENQGEIGENTDVVLDSAETCDDATLHARIHHA